MIRSFPTTLMQDPVFRLRTPDARLVLFTLWMHPSNHLSGLFVLDLDHLALDVRLPLERATSGLKELTDHGLVLRHAPLDQLWLPHMAGLLGNLGNETAPVHKAVSKYVHGLVPSTLCHRVLDSLSIPYRHGSDFPDLCAWLPDDGAHVAQHTQSDTLPNRVPARVLSVSVSGLGSDSGIGSANTLPKTPAARDVSPTPQGAFALTTPAPATPAKAKPAKARKSKEPKEPTPPKEPTAGSVIFAAYRDAFLQRYGVEPPRDSRTNRHFKQVAKSALIGRAPTCSDVDAISEACAVAARYVRHPDTHYIKQQHPPALLERDWHKLVTEHRTGRTADIQTGYGRNQKPESDLEKLGRHFRERREARERGDVIDVQSSRMLDERSDDE